jgi:spore coat polysaccharide biosynthesis protein SpsF
MKTAILITARLGSSRLPKKHFLPVNGQPILQVLLDRITAVFRDELSTGGASIVIATSDEPENRAFERFANKHTQVFYGSCNNIPLRHLQALTSLKYDCALSIDGDDILCSPSGMYKVYEKLRSGHPYVRTTGLPIGMNSSGYSLHFLQQSLVNCGDSVLETGWGRIFSKLELTEIQLTEDAVDDRLRYTLDYKQDYSFFKEIIQSYEDNLITATDEQIIRFTIINKIYRLNHEVSELYWNNFAENMQAEQQ